MDTTNPSMNTITTIQNTVSSYTIDSNVTGYIVTGVVCGVLFILLISFLIAVFVHYRLIRTSPKHTVNMGQCVTNNKPVIKAASNTNNTTKTSNYVEVDRNFIPNDLLNAAHNPNYDEKSVRQVRKNSNTNLPPYSFENPGYTPHIQIKNENGMNNQPSLRSPANKTTNQENDKDPAFNVEITTL